MEKKPNLALLDGATAPTAPAANVFRPAENVEIADFVRASLDPVRMRDVAEKSGAKVVSSWIQLARSGTWKGHAMGEFDFDADVYAQISKNFAKSKNRMVPLDFEHASEERDGGVYQKGAPAQGWIKELRFSDDMLEGRVEWVENQPGLGYVRDGAYKFISPAVVFESIDRQTGKGIGAELVSAALTNRPFLDGMRAVAAKHNAKGTTAMATAIEKDSKTPAEMAAFIEKDAVDPTKAVTNAALIEKDPKEPTTAVTNGDVATAHCHTAKDSDGLTEEQKAEAIAKAKARSASATDLRSSTLAAKMSASYTRIIESLCHEICEEYGWGCYLVEVYDDKAIFENDGGRLWSVDYTFDGSEAELTGAATEVQRTYEPVSKTVTTKASSYAASGARHMPKFEKDIRTALGLHETATDDQVLATVTARDAEHSAMKALLGDVKNPEKQVRKLTALSAIPEQLGLAADVDVSEIPKRIVTLTTKASERDEFETENKALKAKVDEVEKREADAEVDFVIRCGHAYKTPVDASARNALAAYRLSNPAGFATDYKAALDGLKKGDAPHLMSRVTAPGGTLAMPTPEEMTRTSDGEGPKGNDAFEAAVDAEIAEATKNGKTLLRHDAMTAVHRRFANAR